MGGGMDREHSSWDTVRACQPLRRAPCSHGSLQPDSTGNLLTAHDPQGK